VCWGGGVHINSGIPNRAFYETAITVGGYAWDPVGKVWFRTVEERLRPNADFHDFASATTEVARDLYGRDLQLIVENAWRKVGLDPSLTRSGASLRGRRLPSTRTNERRTIP
jgi:Zn-dependent metalloprotease